MKKEKWKIVIKIIKTENDVALTQNIKAPMDMALYGVTALVIAIARKATQSGMSYNEAKNKVLSVIKSTLKKMEDTKE